MNERMVVLVTRPSFVRVSAAVRRFVRFAVRDIIHPTGHTFRVGRFFRWLGVRAPIELKQREHDNSHGGTLSKEYCLGNGTRDH